jgi:molybdopterin-binding protein
MNRHLRKVFIGLVVAGLAGTILSGCVFSVGGGKEVTSARPTRGQELVDLKKAKDQGAITQEEYDAKRKQILER